MCLALLLRAAGLGAYLSLLLVLHWVMVWEVKVIFIFHLRLPEEAPPSFRVMQIVSWTQQEDSLRAKQHQDFSTKMTNLPLSITQAVAHESEPLWTPLITQVSLGRDGEKMNGWKCCLKSGTWTQDYRNSEAPWENKIKEFCSCARCTKNKGWEPLINILYISYT